MNLALDFGELRPELTRSSGAVEGAVAQFRHSMQNDGSPIRAIRHQPAQQGCYEEIPDGVSEPVRQALVKRGIEKLYSHQAEAVRHALAGRDVVVVTPTASGKTLCYNLPILNTLVADPTARALYLFPTKALAEDQRQ